MSNPIINYCLSQEMGMNQRQVPKLPYIFKTSSIPKYKNTSKKIEIIKKEVCRIYNVNPDQIVKKSRKRQVVETRQIIIYLIWFNQVASFQASADAFYPAIKDHTTAIHSKDKVISLMECYPEFRELVESIQKEVLRLFTQLENTSVSM